MVKKNVLLPTDSPNVIGQRRAAAKAKLAAGVRLGLLVQLRNILLQIKMDGHNPGLLSSTDVLAKVFAALQ